MSATDDALIAASVVLPACGRLDLLGRSLDALMRQSPDPRSYEVIVVDAEPKHDTLPLRTAPGRQHAQSRARGRHRPRFHAAAAAGGVPAAGRRGALPRPLRLGPR